MLHFIHATVLPFIGLFQKYHKDNQGHEEHAKDEEEEHFTSGFRCGWSI
jgi:hypothetical protein